jgi:hypothetical protein
LITISHHAENRFSIASALNRVFSGGDKDAPFGCSQAFQDRPEQSV